MSPNRLSGRESRRAGSRCRWGSGLYLEFGVCRKTGRFRQRYVVLGASGCGAFVNPAASIAQIYKEELTDRLGGFDCVAFAIFSAGYGPGNFPIFRRVFD